MGFSLAWIGVRGRSKNSVLSFLSLTESDELVENNIAELAGTQFSDFWYLITMDNIIHPLVDEKILTGLSSGCEVIACQLDERFMTSSISLYSNGSLKWNVCHFSEHGIYHMDVEGQPPNEYYEIYRDMKFIQDNEGGEDAGVDYLFDVPVLLGYRLCGYRHDEISRSSPRTVFRKLTLM
jgi:hypothetical protein